MDLTTILFLIMLLPLTAFVVNAFTGSRMKNPLPGILATAAVSASALLSLWVAFQYFFVINTQAGGYEPIVPFYFEWLPFTETLVLNMGFLLDPVSVMMLVVVTLISSLVHLYSIEYMKKESGFARYFTYLSLFTFSMMGLVLSMNILQVYVFWELVGVSSFLLIGFFYTSQSAVAASKKAFIVTRFADFFFLIGILVFAFYADTMDFLLLFERLADPTSSFYLQMASASFLGLSAIFWVLMLVFIGGAGKSAIFPLHIWLPDAMEGPTPVSALIHAATMVVAGVFLVARLFPIYYFGEPIVLDLIAYGAAFTALFAAVIACVQNDIKRILAYSTISQIAFMLLALGVSGYAANGLGYTASMFHLFTHAMFKALLFLGAGAIIHYVHTNDITKMGSLRKYMPVTHAMFLIACLAIAGIPPFAGFFSKEEILTAVFASNKLLYIVAIFTAGMTAFYIFRLYFMVFWNREQQYEGGHKEAGFPMLTSLVILGILSAVTGFVPFSNLVTTTGTPLETHFHIGLMLPAVLVALIGIGIAFTLYKSPVSKLLSPKSALHTMAVNKFYIDEAWLFVTRKFIFGTVSETFTRIETNIVDKAVHLSGSGTEYVSDKIKIIQSGKLQAYLLFVFLGLITIMGLAIYWATRLLIF